jgi:hypothetical protein
VGEIDDGITQEQAEEEPVELPDEQKEESMLIGHELAKEFDASGNSADA